MDVGRHPEVLCGGPHRLVVRVRVGLLIVLGKPKHPAALFAHPGHLIDGRSDVVREDLGDGDQPVGVALHLLGRPAVVGADEAGQELRMAAVVHLDDALHERHGRVQELHVDPLRVADPDACLGVVVRVTAVRFVVLRLHRLGLHQVATKLDADYTEGIGREVLLRHRQGRTLDRRGQNLGGGEIRRGRKLGRKLRVGAGQPVDRFVEVGINIDDSHWITPKYLKSGLPTAI